MPVAQTYAEYSEQYDIAHRVLSKRGLPQNRIRLYVALEGDYIPAQDLTPDDAYLYMSMKNGHPHGHPHGVDPFRHGRPKSYQNQGWHNQNGHDPFHSHLNFGPDMPRPEPKLRDDLAAQYRPKPKPY